MDDLISFLRAQLDEDERAVAAILRGVPNWRVDTEPWPSGVGVVNDQNDGVAIAIGSFAAEHIARHDPARVLREVESKRRILAEHSELDRGMCQCLADFPCATVRLLALPYADRPGYRESWRPGETTRRQATQQAPIDLTKGDTFTVHVDDPL